LGANWHEFIPEWKIGRETEMIERIVGDTPRIFAVQVSIRHDLGLVFMADVTDLQDKEEQVRHMQRLDSLGHLAGGVAHDFNNILSIINGYGQLLAGWAGDDTKAKPATDAILNACKRGSGLTTKLLALARRKKVGGDESCDLNTALLQIESLLRPLIPKNIDLGFSVPPRPVHVRASEDHLHQIIMNLVVNARDAMQEGANGAIDVRCTIEPNIDGDENYSYVWWTPASVCRPMFKNASLNRSLPQKKPGAAQGLVWP
jgi:signal transduction histidine kinase